MADTDYTEVPLAVRFVPDALTPAEDAAGSTRELGAGTYEFGAVVDGAFVAFAARKGGGVQKRIDAAKAAKQAKQDEPTPTEPQPAGSGPEPTV